jgi:tripartite-type tricarboxylate transporter receptor subunit TctC
MIESGLPNVTTVTYYGLLAPSGTPSEVVASLNSAVNESLRSPELVSAMTRLGFGLKSGSPEEFAALIADQSGRWGPIVKRIAFQME